MAAGKWLDGFVRESIRLLRTPAGRVHADCPDAARVTPGPGGSGSDSLVGHLRHCQWLDVLATCRASGRGRRLGDTRRQDGDSAVRLDTAFLRAVGAIVYLWIGSDFSWRSVRTGGSRSFFAERLLPNLFVNWIIWIPVGFAVHAFPTPLQVHIAGFANAFLCLVLLTLGKRT